MKHPIPTIIIAFLLTIYVSGTALATSPPPPPPQHGSSGNVPGGGASISGGLAILLSLGFGYGASKYYQRKKRSLQE